MTPPLMSPQEMVGYAAHMVQLAMHAGQSLGDVSGSAPPQHRAAIRQMIEAARAFYRAASQFEKAATAHAEAASEDFDAQCKM